MKNVLAKMKYDKISMPRLSTLVRRNAIQSAEIMLVALSLEEKTYSVKVDLRPFTYDSMHLYQEKLQDLCGEFFRDQSFEVSIYPHVKPHPPDYIIYEREIN